MFYFYFVSTAIESSMYINHLQAFIHQLSLTHTFTCQVLLAKKKVILSHTIKGSGIDSNWMKKKRKRKEKELYHEENLEENFQKHDR